MLVWIRTQIRTSIWGWNRWVIWAFIRAWIQAWIRILIRALIRALISALIRAWILEFHARDYCVTIGLRVFWSSRCQWHHAIQTHPSSIKMHLFDKLIKKLNEIKITILIQWKSHIYCNLKRKKMNAQIRENSWRLKWPRHLLTTESIKIQIDRY